MFATFANLFEITAAFFSKEMNLA